MKPQELYEIMSKIPLFKGFNIEEIEEILKTLNFQIKNYKKGETVFFRGDALEQIIIILSGTSKGEMQKFNGDTIVINQMKAGEVLASAFLFGKDNVFPVDFL